MANLKRTTLHLSSGKQIKLFGNSIAIGKNLQIGEGYAPNIFSCNEQLQESKTIAETAKESAEGKPAKKKTASKTIATVVNPYHLTANEIMDLADYNIRLWLDLKDNIREFGVGDPKVFNMDGSK